MSKTSSYTKGYLSMNQNCSMENMKEEVSIDGKKHGWNEGAFGKIPPPILIGLSPPSITNKLNLYILSICACAVYGKNRLFRKLGRHCVLCEKSWLDGKERKIIIKFREKAYCVVRSWSIERGTTAEFDLSDYQCFIRTTHTQYA